MIRMGTIDTTTFAELNVRLDIAIFSFISSGDIVAICVGSRLADRDWIYVCSGSFERELI